MVNVDYRPERAAAAVIDLFAGPGGWDLAAGALGWSPLGVEWDEAACRTREEAGLWTLRGDVAALDPVEVLDSVVADGRLDGLIASPPCQAFSMAGKGDGRRAIDVYRMLVGEMGRGVRVAAFDHGWLAEQCHDERAHLVLEPLRWALALRPRWVALEQVPPVLPVWEAMAAVLRSEGWQTWSGVLTAERYGVPQTRRRAIMLARMGAPVGEPPASHARYVPPRRREAQEEALFAAPEPERVTLPEDRELLPWVSMAEALGWPEGIPIDHHRGAGMVERHGERTPRHTGQPAPAVTAGGSRWEGGPRWTLRASDRSQATVRGVDEPAPTITAGHDHGERRWVVETGNFSAVARDADGGRSAAGSVPYQRPTSDPSPTVDGSAGGWRLRAGTGEHEAERAQDEPAPTLRFGGRLNAVEWTHYDSRGQRDGRTGEPNRRRGVDEPAPTIAGESRNDSWAADRPATTVAGDERVHPPGHKVNAEDLEAGRDGYDGRAGERAVRVTLEEALVLQSFPAGWPVWGTKTKRFEQVGNAIPPLLALACLAEAAG